MKHEFFVASIGKCFKLLEKAESQEQYKASLIEYDKQEKERITKELKKQEEEAGKSVSGFDWHSKEVKK